MPQDSLTHTQLGIPDSTPLESALAMTTAVLEPRTHQFDVEDIEYLRHGDKPLLARVFRPRGEGPFPALVECHGGAWCLERGEEVETPPAVWFQCRARVLHDYKAAYASFPANEPH